MSLTRISVSTFLLIAGWPWAGEARIILVPQEAPTIQAGLDSLTDSDTVHVALGIYPEFLLAPAFTFALIGEYQPEFGDSARPRVDASALPATDTMAVLRLPPLARATIENFYFRNGTRNGIRSWAAEMSLRNCILDSVQQGIRHVPFDSGAVYCLEECRFESIPWCLYVGANRIQVLNCDFTGRPSSQTGSLVAIAGHGSTLSSCSLGSPANQPLLYASQGPNEVADCSFGPAVATGALQNVIECGYFRGRFVGNAFDDCEYESALIHLWEYDPDSVEITGNHFSDCRGIGPQSNGVIAVSYPETTATRGLLISDNSFENCSGNQYFADDIAVHGGRVHITGNRFVRDGINGLPAIATWDSLQDSVILRDNLFEDCGYALHGQTFVDARWNWWGDSTGPYHVTENPGGLGDTITGNVNFIPWQVDTSFLSVPDPAQVQPSEFLLEAWPNPFNSSLRIILAGFTGRNFEITLHNLLGQVVDVIHRGPMTGGEITYQAPSYLASGVYFIRATDHVAVQTKKVVLLK